MLVGFHLENGGTEVVVETDNSQVGGSERLADGLLCLPGLDGEAKLAVQHPCRGVDVGVWVHRGGDPQHDVLGLALTGSHLLQQRQLVEVVHHNAAYAP